MENNHPGIQSFLPSHGLNRVNHSRLKEYNEHVNSSIACGIKFVIKGTENYLINNTVHTVKENQFLLINKGQNFYCSVREKNVVEGICLYLEDSLLQTVHKQISQSPERLLDNPGPDRYGQLEFYETIYYQSDCLHQFLTKEISKIRGANDNSFYDVDNFYYETAYYFLLSQQYTGKHIQKIKALKNSTRKEIYRRVSVAKSIIDSDISLQPDISFLSTQCRLSEFHFLRSFKEAFSITPHQYLLKRRMEKSMQLLATGKISVTDTAYEVGFSNVCSFSKCFKKYFKTSAIEIKQPR